MSAGTGIEHSEFNKNKDKRVKFLQIWVYPNKQNVVPRYAQISLHIADRHNRLQEIVSPFSAQQVGSVWVYQDAWFHIAKFDERVSTTYTLKKQDNGVYVFVLHGKVKLTTKRYTREMVWGVECIVYYD